MLTRDAILSAEDLRTEDVDIPEWNGRVTVRELSGAERDEYESSIVTRDGDKVDINPVNMRAKLVVIAVIDEDGNRMFSMKDAVALGKKSATALDRLADVIRRISGMDKDSMDEAGKESAEVPSAD